MKIVINVDENRTDTEIVINCPRLSSETENIIAALHMLDSRLAVTREGSSYILDISDIAYIETVDRHTFVYTEKECYESKLKLYEIEDRLCGTGFQRVSKSCIVRLRYIRSIKAELDRKLRLTLENGEQLIVSRQYADDLKQRLGVV